jgi:hypothetical protein
MKRVRAMDDLAGYQVAVQKTASAMIRQYGADAEIVATMQAAEVAALGDADGLAVWELIIECIVAMASEMAASRSRLSH